MEFIHHARLMRHHKYICECVKSIGGNGSSWIKNTNSFCFTCLGGRNQLSVSLLIPIFSTFTGANKFFFKILPRRNMTKQACLVFEFIPRDAIKQQNQIPNLKEENTWTFPFSFCWHVLFTESWLTGLLWLISVLVSLTHVCYRAAFCSIGKEGKEEKRKRVPIDTYHSVYWQ